MLLTTITVLIMPRSSKKETRRAILEMLWSSKFDPTSQDHLRRLKHHLVNYNRLDPRSESFKVQEVRYGSG